MHYWGEGSMAWLQRGQKRYYYQTICKNGRRTSHYVGTGAAVERLLQEVATRKQDRLQRLHEQQCQEQATAPLLDLARLTDALLTATLLAEGFHYYQRRWRKKREHRQPDTRHEGLPG